MIKASEDNGYTNMEFYRNATTDDDEELDVQHTVRFKSSNFKPQKKKRKIWLAAPANHSNCSRQRDVTWAM